MTIMQRPILTLHSCTLFFCLVACGGGEDRRLLPLWPVI